MSKKMIPVMMAAALMMTALPAEAAGDLSNVSPSGDTAVTGKVEETDVGDVTYTISIPEKIDFGTLQQPEDQEEAHICQKQMTIKAEYVDGLQEGTRVAVLVKDSAETEDSTDFKIVGQDLTNSGQKLVYTIENAAVPGTLINQGTRYPNGYLVSTFKEVGDSTTLDLKLDQNQLYGKYLPQWAGNYKGTLNFYSTVVDINSIN